MTSKLYDFQIWKNIKFKDKISSENERNRHLIESVEIRMKTTIFLKILKCSWQNDISSTASNKENKKC